MIFRSKLFPVFLSIIFFFLSFFQTNITVYASNSSHGGGGSSSSTRPDGEEWFENDQLGSDKIPLVLGFLTSELKCLTDGNFGSFMTNYFDMKEYFTSKHISISEEPDENGDYSMIFSEDLTSAFKQALLEYAEETNGFFLMPTTDINTMPPTMFASSYNYNSFKNLVAESGCIAVADERHSSVSFSVFRPFHSSRPISLVRANNLNFSSYCEVNFYDTYSWTKYSFNYRVFYTRYKDNDGYVSYKTFKSWDEAENYSTKGYAHIGWKLVPGSGNIGAPSSNTFVLYSTDGRKLKVFNSLNALKNYTTGQRSVYFGSGFYDEPGEIQVSFDDLEKYIDGKYDDFFNDLKDLINKETDNEDSLTEEDLEKLVDQILDKMDEIGGGNNSGDGNDKPGTDNDNTGFLQGMLDALSGYLDEITAYLDGILIQLGYISNQIEDMTADAVEEKADSVLLELFSAFGEIGDLLKTKFPFSIPWDIYSMLSFLSSDDPYDTPARAAPASYFDTGIMTYSSEDGLVINYDDAVMSSTEIDADSGIMPLMTNEDVNSGGNHGGGGSSRPGVGSHYDSEGKYHRAPFYEIPFVISKNMGIEGTLIIDLDPFIPLSEISRTMFTCIFIMSLISLSTKIVDALGDLFPSG